MITVDEFRTLNRCLDDAIADAVTEFGRQRDQFVADESARSINERLGFLAHELRNHIQTAILAAAAIRKGNVGPAGATGAVLDRSLFGLRDLVDRTLLEVRLTGGIPARREEIIVAGLIADAQAAAALQAAVNGLELEVMPVREGLTVEGDRQLLAGALTNLLQNAVKFTRPRTRVSLRAYPLADRILIEIEDECGGLPEGVLEQVFHPFEQLGTTKPGMGLGLAISRHAVEANGGKLYARTLPGTGCVFTIDLPRARPPAS